MQLRPANDQDGNASDYKTLAEAMAAAELHASKFEVQQLRAAGG